MKTLIILLVFSCVPTWGALTSKQFEDTRRRLILNVSNTQWDFFHPEEMTKPNQKRDLELQFVARGPSNEVDHVQPSLTFRVDKGKWSTAKKYAERWLKEYPKFGYELQNSRKRRLGILNVFEIEMTSKVSPRQIRQYIVRRPKEIWIFTCSADMANHSRAFSDCERILSTSYLSKNFRQPR